MLITGPPGVGKTASVYACAQELGFKVFDVNASSQRSGRHILTQLKEATQSHLVEIQGSTTFKPSHLIADKRRPLPERLSHPLGRGLSSLVAPTIREVQCSAASMMLANVFKKKRKPEIKLKTDLCYLQNRTSSYQTTVTVKKADIINPTLVSQLSPDIEEPPTGSRSKRMSTSLILFEEQVDVVFNDVGFLTAIKTFMTTTKRPVILTTSGVCLLLHLVSVCRAPSQVNVCSYLQLLCLAENVRMDAGDITSLVSLNQMHIRRTLLQLWICSGGGQASQRATPLKDPAGGVYGSFRVSQHPLTSTTLRSHCSWIRPVKVSSGSRPRRKMSGNIRFQISSHVSKALEPHCL
ncbi:unnamed protein product [Oncorhynchus mykiss]|uniref:ATPase AAA-type core domain-containing protein n=1 Tax=Oncorhynchus mykiss TaxID=8022 RepID=A0A060YBM4_ONCMY|nr:unnamed protein product [Oncorhynchus mykiss]